MESNSKTIKTDTRSLVLTLTYGENLQALTCAEKIRNNLIIHIGEGKEEYKRNLEIVDRIIAEHREQLSHLEDLERLSNAS